jgi:phosphoadenylyl-sulfate reductase (thioredoxin)
MRFSERKVRDWNRTLARCSPLEIVSWGLGVFREKILVICGVGPGSGMLLDLIAKLNMAASIATIDSLVLHPESYELIDAYREKYGFTIEVLQPCKKDLEMLPGPPSLELFRGNEDAWLRCCDVRKTLPLTRALQGHLVWMDSLIPNANLEDRQVVPLISIDHVHGGILKINPLAKLTERTIWEYVRRHGVPYNKLFDNGYGSIGCREPCTVPAEGRKGRFPWLQNRSKAICRINLIKKIDPAKDSGKS